ncbi:MAG: HNH endonuclease [Rhodospirillaceae bacterium]|nr:HNH endonuclease [Rhodospirillaceae bacterium]
MTSRKESNGNNLPVPAPELDEPLVTRSKVPVGKEYGEYKEYLRYDFFHSCSYCTMSEAEAQAIRFVIDHYEPRKARPELVHEYENLMYSCDECNVRKGDRCPPAEARADNYRFFRPDRDKYREHFQGDGVRLKSKTNVGKYSIQALDLNRLTLRRLRDIRKRLTNCDRHVIEGVLGLRKFHIDRLPPSIKGSAARAIRQVVAVSNELADGIDDLLRDCASSPLIDPDLDSNSRLQERTAKLKQLKAIYPGTWRAPRKNQS